MNHIACLLFFMIAFSVSGQDTLTSQSMDYFYIKKNKIDENIFFVNSKFSNVEIQRLVNEFPYKSAKAVMLDDLRQIKIARKKRRFLCALGISAILMGTGPMGLVIGQTHDNFLATAVVLPFFVLGSLSTGISQIWSYDYHQKKKSIIETYNKYQ